MVPKKVRPQQDGVHVGMEAAYFAPCLHLFVVHLYHSHGVVHEYFLPFLGTLVATLSATTSSSEGYVASVEDLGQAKIFDEVPKSHAHVVDDNWEYGV